MILLLLNLQKSDIPILNNLIELKNEVSVGNDFAVFLFYINLYYIIAMPTLCEMEL